MNEQEYQQITTDKFDSMEAPSPDDLIQGQRDREQTIVVHTNVDRKKCPDSYQAKPLLSKCACMLIAMCFHAHQWGEGEKAEAHVSDGEKNRKPEAINRQEPARKGQEEVVWFG